MMREEIEAAALFITRLVNKNLSQYGSNCSSASSTHSHSSSSSSSSSDASSTSSASSSSESPPRFDDPPPHQQTQPSQTTASVVATEDKVEQFRQCLTQALYERFHDHWFPEQPTKGQAYRCIRLNEWDRHDIALQQACLQCGIDYKDLQLPVELTLWVDPDEVTCRFGENKGSHCLVAKFKDGEIKDDNTDFDINNIDIEIYRQSQTSPGKTRQLSFQGSPDYTNRYQSNGNMNNNTNKMIQHHQQQQNGSYHYLNNPNIHHQQHHQAPQTPPQQHHYRLNGIGKTPPVLAPYNHNYLNGCDSNGNPIYYFK